MSTKAAKTLGRLGGKARSESKAAAARANGARGGRPSSDLRAIRKIADKYGVLWHKEGGGWVINGIVQAPYYPQSNAGEKCVLVDYLTKWGRGVMAEEDYRLVLDANASLNA